ncbi:MAG: T9SS type A sorting domain-containing protein [bacterium]|nr:T9SS type A sorting domain-containing protein [bacterium]
MRVQLTHDGNWSNSADSRLRRYSRSFNEALGIPATGSDRGVIESENGVYLIVVADAYLDAVQPLVEWKHRKGFRVEVVTTSVTGGTKEEIRDWIRNAYNTWAVPPEYLLLMGDIDLIPSYLIGPNSTDNPYGLMDDDDWLPDLFVGRISVESVFEAETAINKIAAYERTPDTDNPAWVNSYLGAATNHGADTPEQTVRWCMSQLDDLGWNNGHVVNPDYFDPELVTLGDLMGMEYLGGVFDPFHVWYKTVPQINGSLDNGVSMLIYRGWAIGVDGWEEPRYTSEYIPGLDNGNMNPVVLSFVCDTGCYSYDQRPCMGEAWLRAGSPEEAKGAVAFIGNTVFWSHTRYNDSMAASFFEKFGDEGITDMGRWMLAARTRFVEYWPHLEDFEDHLTKSAEFYFSVYNLLGEPELNMHRDAQTAIVVDHDATLPVGANVVYVSVMEADGTTPLAGARVGVVQGDTWLGCAFTDASGTAGVPLESFIMGTDLAVTVTCPDRLPEESIITTGNADAFVTLDSFVIDDSAGNDDGIVNPGETVAITATLRNAGALGATTLATSLLDAGAPVTIGVDGSTAADIAGGGTAVIDSPYSLTVDSDVEDGRRIHLEHVVEHVDGEDVSVLMFDVVAPKFIASAFTLGEDGYLLPGQANDIVIELTNIGHAATAGCEVDLILGDPTVGSVSVEESSYPAIEVEASAVNTTAFVLDLNADVPAGKLILLSLAITTAEGYDLTIDFTLGAGRINPAAPVGPDAFGYYAYDSSDIFYTEKPDFRWREISPAYGGDGDPVVYWANDEMASVVIPFDFDFYGVTYNAMQVADDGWISFDTEEFFSFYNWGLPNEHGLHSIIAPFWDNFNPTYHDTIYLDDGVYTKYDDMEHIFIVEWSRMRSHYEALSDRQTFQLVLFDPEFHDDESFFEFQYYQVNNNNYLRNYATIGIEDQTEAIGLELSYASMITPGMTPVGPGLAVRLTTLPPVYLPLALDSFTADPDIEGLKLSWSLSDDRPICGWRLYRTVAGVETRVGGDLAAYTRNVIDHDADPTLNNEYRLVALHPYEQESDLGPWYSLTDLNTTLQFSLSQNLPNPMVADSRIDYVLPESADVTLKVYNAAGRLVRTLVEGMQPAGHGSAMWDGKGTDGQSVATGVYFYRLETGGRILTRKLMLIR